MGRGQKYHDNKATMEVIKGNVACKDAVTMQLWPSRYIHEQEPMLFEPQCSVKWGNAIFFSNLLYL